MKPHARFLDVVLFVGVASSVMVAQAAPLSTVRNSTLSVLAASIAAAGLPGTTNLAGSNFMLSAVMPLTASAGRAALVNSQQWVRRYNAGPASFQNAGYAMAVRGDGSVIVTGPSQPWSAAADDFVTLAYAPDGVPLWTNRYDGPGHADDYSYYVATSGAGDVWVTGRSMRYATNWDLTDAAVIKYASNGAPLWTNRYNSFETNGAWPSALAVDGSGNAYVGVSSAYWSGSGYGGTPMEDAIIKYDPQGNTVWTKHFPRSAPYSEGGVQGVKAMAMDDAGNLLVAGENAFTGTSIVKYSGDGAALWTNQDSLPFMNGLTLLSVDRQGNAILTVELITNYPVTYVVMKRSRDGASVWTNTLTGPLYDGGDVPQTVFDPAGNVFLIGAKTRATWPGFYQVLKMSSDGVLLWTNQNIALGPTNCMIGNAAADSAGNLYFASYVPSPANGYADAVVFKYSGDGQPVWTNRFDGPAGLNDYPFCLAVDGAGNVYVTGESERLSGAWDLTTVKYADLLFYTPPKDFTGSDTITYTLTDSLGNSATGSVVVVVAPGAFQFNLDSTVTRLTPGGLQLQLDGAPGTNAVVIEASSDFRQWVPIATNALTNGSVQLLDSAATNLPHRFYRALQPQ